MRIAAIMLMMTAPMASADTVLTECQFDTACGSEGNCTSYEFSLNVVRDDTFVLRLSGPDANVRVQRSASGPLTVFSGTGYEPNDTGEDGGFTSLVLHENGDAVILSAVALPLGGGTLDSGLFHGSCQEVSE